MARRFTKTDALKAILQAIRNDRARQRTLARLTPFLGSR